MRYVHERVGGTATLARSNVHLGENIRDCRISP